MLYAREPISQHAGIPIFSRANAYTENYERISKDHLDHFQATGQNPFIKEDLWVASEHATIGLIRKYSKPGDRILDIGVGLGRMLSEFPQLSRHGMDISLRYLEVAKSKGIDVCYSLVEDMPFKAESFDVVLCADILEHVLDLNEACARALFVLKPSGHLIVRVPYREDLKEYLSSKYEFLHMRSFDEFSLTLLFEKIFRCRVVETITAVYHFEPSRFRFPITRGHRLLHHFLAIMRRVAPGAHAKLLRMIFWPVEINIVVRKP